MLVYIDLLIGFAVVMLGVSLLIMILTQMTAALLRLRSGDLRQGVERLLQNADPALEPHAREVAEAVLGHELVKGSMLEGRASTIRKEELRNLLDAVADPDGFAWQKAVADRLDAAKESVETWFDSVMDRSSQRFAAKTRVATAIFAVLLAFVLHLDAGDLLVRLGTDAELRAKLVAGSDVMVRQTERLAERTAEEQVAEELEALQGSAEELQTDLGAMGIDLRPDWLASAEAEGSSEAESSSEAEAASEDESPPDGGATAGSSLSRCQNFWAGLDPRRLHFWGILASAALLALGAPFWFNTLKTLGSLRPIVAQKEERERERARGA
ncbi:MAG: hypothetical protein ACLF0P_06990 [Thermoanaerobaculia bacterium]